MKVCVNPPKTPVTKGSNGIAPATIPNICKMPGPPAPFVPVPLPNIGKSGSNPKGYSKKVKVEGKTVAIKGATFDSTGDVASKGTGGGLVSANTHGPTKFVGPGSLDVKFEGKNVQYLGDPMLNNCGPSGSPPNAATLMGVINPVGLLTAFEKYKCGICGKNHGDIKENEKTKESARKLAARFRDELLRSTRRTLLDGDGRPIRGTMLGVVGCKCGKKYADQSGTTHHELQMAADRAGLRRQRGQRESYAGKKEKEKIANERISMKSTVLKRIKARTGQTTRPELAWHKAESMARKTSKKAKTANPPGACAAQRTIFLAMSNGALSTSMTERWYHPNRQPMSRSVEHYDLRVNSKSPIARRFNVGESVPPCVTCLLIVPLLLCAGDRPSCDHQD